MTPKSEIYSDLSADILMKSILTNLKSVRRLSDVKNTIINVLDMSNNSLTYYNSSYKTRLLGLDKVNIVIGKVSNIEFELEIEKFIFRNPKINKFKWEVLDGCF